VHLSGVSLSAALRTATHLTPGSTGRRGGPRLPRAFGEDAVSVQLSGVSLPARSARRCRARGCWQTIQGSSGKPSHRVLSLIQATGGRGEMIKGVSAQWLDPAVEVPDEHVGTINVAVACAKILKRQCPITYTI